MGSVVTMEQGAILQHQLPLPSDYSQPSDHEFIVSFAGPSHHSQYTNGGAVDPLRRDGNVTHPTFALTSTKGLHGARFISDGSLPTDGTSYRAGNNFSDSSSGSISASPSSGVSLLAYNSLPATHYTSVPAFSNAVHLPQTTLVPGFHTGYRAPSILDSSASGILPLPHHMRSPVSNGKNASDRDTYAHSTPLLARNQLSSNGYGHYTDTPRSVLSTSTLFSPGSGAYPPHMASNSQNYPSPQNDCSNFPWPNLEVLLVMTCEGQEVTPEVHAKVEKGFFPAPGDQKWTCYRRNYFSVNCSFELHPNINNARMYLKRNSATEQVQAMGMRLSAAVDGSGGKNIELIQHTPKRDNGPKNKINVVKVSPMPTSGGRQEHTLSPHTAFQIPMSTFLPTGTVPGPCLPFQNTPERGSPPASATHTPQISASYPYGGAGSHLPMPGQSTSHTFERVQFKQATANNGKRRASQQYFHLIVELFADVRKDGSDNPIWVKVAQRVSEKIVVRGRSPSHYQNEGQHGQNGRGGATGGGGYPSSSSYSGINSGGFRGSVGGYARIGGGSGYPANHYGLHASSGESASSPESVEGGAMDSDHPMDAAMSDADRAGIADVDGYSYHPSTIYEHMPNQLPLPKIETGPRYSTEPRQYAVKAEYPDAIPGSNWHIGTFGRFQGFESSRNFFPDLSSGAANYS